MPRLPINAPPPTTPQDLHRPPNPHARKDTTHLHRHPNDLTYTPTENPFPPGPHTLTRAIRLLDTQNTPTHLFFLLHCNTSPLSATLLSLTVSTAKKRRAQVGGEVHAVAKAALTSNRPALVKVMDTAWGELFVSEVGREDLAVVMYEVDRTVWGLAGVGTSISEGRVYLLRNAPEEEERDGGQ